MRRISLQGGAYGVVRVHQTVVRVGGRGWAFYEPKTEVGKRPVYFPAWLYYDLMAHKGKAGTASRCSGRPWQRGCFNPPLVRAGLPAEFTPYTLRRPFSSLLRRGGVSAKEVNEQMGHTNVNFTEDVYVTVYDSAKREMSDKPERVLSGGVSTQQAHNETEAVM